MNPEKIKKRMNIFSILYIMAFALVLSLIAYDLVMSLDPHWISTLFGAYSFVKAFYLGLGGLIIFAAVLHLHPRNNFKLESSHFHDVGKLFFAFCLVWADFFYVLLVVIWYVRLDEAARAALWSTVRAGLIWIGLASALHGRCFLFRRWWSRRSPISSARWRWLAISW